MNVFTTDHPMIAQTSWFDEKEHPRLSFVCRVAVVALAFTPFVMFRICEFVMNDVVETTPVEEPGLLWLLVVGGGFAYGVSCAVSVPLVAGYGWLRNDGGSDEAVRS
jgi:hypothetical protein